MTLKLYTQLTFSETIESLVREKRISYLDAVLYYTQTNQIEPESVSKLLSANLKSKIEQEAQDLHLIKRGKRKLKVL